MRRFFDCIVEQCRQAGLVWDNDLYFDTTQVEATDDRDKRLPCYYVDAINDHLTALFVEGNTSREQPGLPAEPTPTPLLIDLPPDVAAELTAANAARHVWFVALGRPNRLLQAA